LKGEVEDVPRVAAEIMKVSPKIETPSGPLAFDQYHQRVITMYVLKTEKRDGKLGKCFLIRWAKWPRRTSGAGGTSR
jgi:hypothetical protein